MNDLLLVPSPHAIMPRTDAQGRDDLSTQITFHPGSRKERHYESPEGKQASKVAPAKFGGCFQEEYEDNLCERLYFVLFVWHLIMLAWLSGCVRTSHLHDEKCKKAERV